MNDQDFMNIYWITPEDVQYIRGQVAALWKEKIMKIYQDILHRMLAIMNMTPTYETRHDGVDPHFVHRTNGLIKVIEAI